MRSSLPGSSCLTSSPNCKQWRSIRSRSTRSTRCDIASAADFDETHRRVVWIVRRQSCSPPGGVPPSMLGDRTGRLKGVIDGRVGWCEIVKADSTSESAAVVVLIRLFELSPASPAKPIAEKTKGSFRSSTQQVPDLVGGYNVRINCISIPCSVRPQGQVLSGTIVEGIGLRPNHKWHHRSFRWQARFSNAIGIFTND